MKRTKPPPRQPTTAGADKKDALADASAPPDEIASHTRSPLGMYLKLNGLSMNSFARAVGVNFATVVGWSNGTILPSLPAAWWIEHHTKGVVPMESWLAIPYAKQQLAKWRARQPEEVREALMTELNAPKEELDDLRLSKLQGAMRADDVGNEDVDE